MPKEIKKAEKQGTHIRKEDISLEPFYPEKIMYKGDILYRNIKDVDIYEII